MLLARRAAVATFAVAASASLTARARMAPVTPLPSTAELRDAPLKPLLASSGEVIRAGALWRDAPAVILAVRRPGCQLCRAEVSELQRIKPQLDAAGVRLVAVLHEEREEQVAEFKSDYWPGELFLDETKAVFKAVGGGSVRRGSLLSFLNPFSRIWCAPERTRAAALAPLAPRALITSRRRRTHVRESNRTVQKSNLVGDGLTFGGLLVVRRDGKVQYAFQVRSALLPACFHESRVLSSRKRLWVLASQELTFGDHAPPDDVLDAALKAAAAR